jgi:multicomponent Na+:H+ antiporter subunit C
MTLLLILTIGLTVAAGVYLLLAPDLFRLVVGLTVLGGAGNLILFMSGRPRSLVPPVIESGGAALPGGFANPLPQALVLTAIVIGFALLCFALVLGARLARTTREPDRLRATEPVAHDPVKPPIEDA